VQYLAGFRARGDDRVVAALARVAEPRALLGVAEDLADEAVDVDRQAPRARSGAGLPRARERLGEQPVELAHVPEGLSDQVCEVEVTDSALWAGKGHRDQAENENQGGWFVSSRGAREFR
jgi:hypothetical protein